MNTRDLLTGMALAGLVLGGCAPAAAQTGARGAATTGSARATGTTGPVGAGAAETLGVQVLQEAGPAFVEVSAVGRVDATTDRAVVRFAVETEATDAAEASQENARRMDAVLQAVRELGVEGTELETSGYQLSPIYRRPAQGGTQEIAGYRAQNFVEVTLDDVDAVGRVIDAAIGAGANRIAGLTFTARDTRPARLEALRIAVERAREEAETMAAALGVPLGPPLEVRTGGETDPPRPMMMRMEAAQADVSTPIEAGDQTVTAHVTVRYRLQTGG